MSTTFEIDSCLLVSFLLHATVTKLYFFICTDDESKLLEEITGGMASARIKTRDPFNGGLPKLPDVSPRPAQGFGLPQKGISAGNKGALALIF